MLGVISAKQHGAVDRGNSGSTFDSLFCPAAQQDCTGHSPANTRQYRHAHTQRNSAARWRHSFVTVWYVAISLGPPLAFPTILLFLPLCLPRGFVHLSILRHEGLFCKIEKKKKTSKAPDCWELTVHFLCRAQDLCFPFVKAVKDEFGAFYFQGQFSSRVNAIMYCAAYCSYTVMGSKKKHRLFFSDSIRTYKTMSFN